MKYLLILMILASCGSSRQPVIETIGKIEKRICNEFANRDCWYLQNTDTLHNIDAPAMISYMVSGEKWVEFYYNEGVLHRLAQPAVIRYCKDGSIEKKIYFENGVFLFDTVLKTC